MPGASARRTTRRSSSPASTGISSTPSGYSSIRCSICWSATGELFPDLDRPDGPARSHARELVCAAGSVERHAEPGNRGRQGTADRAVLHAPAARGGAAAHRGPYGDRVAGVAFRSELDRYGDAHDIAGAVVSAAV